MPIFEFHCNACGKNFEDIILTGNAAALCPECGSENVEKTISAPSPLKKGAFPFKPGPPHPVASRMGQGCAACGAACKE